MADSVRTEKGSLPTSIGREQCRDTGMALTLVCLLLAWTLEDQNFSRLAVAILLINMACPQVYRLPARLWFGLSNLLGTIMSKIILTVIFFGVVTPVGILRRAGGWDPLQRKRWKKDAESVFRVRNHTFAGKDIEQPY